MKIKEYNWSERINKQPVVGKPKHFIKHYARFCLNREHVGQLLKSYIKLKFFHNFSLFSSFMVPLYRFIGQNTRFIPLISRNNLQNSYKYYCYAH